MADNEKDITGVGARLSEIEKLTKTFNTTGTGSTVPVYVGGGGGGGYSAHTGVTPVWYPASNISGTGPLSSGSLVLAGADADIVINGVSLTDTLVTLSERLNILIPNPVLEKEWDELKELGEEYRKKSKEFEEKSRMWNTLKKT